MKYGLKRSIFFIGVFILCFLNISKVNALNIDVNDVKVKNRNSSAKVGDTTFKGQNINSKITLHKIGAYVEYELTLNNNESKIYQIKKITNNLKNKNIKISFNSEELKNNDKAKLNIKIKYDKKIQNSIKNKDLELTLNLKEQDNILIYFICLISATIGVIFIITTRKHKNLRLIAATLTIIPILILVYWSLDTDKYKIKLDNITVIGYNSSSRSSGDGVSSFKVSIDPGNGEEPIERIVDYGDKIGKLPTPSKDGYEFEGWVDDQGKPVTEDTEVNDEMYIEAVYKSLEFKISYELNGGENNIENPMTYTAGSEDVTLKEPTRSTYIFTGWTGSNGKKAQKDVTIKNGTEGDLNYTAHYTKSADKLNVLLNSETFIYTGKEINPEVVVKDGKTTLKENVDYTISYEDNIESGTARVIVTMLGKENKKTNSSYEGETTKEFTITKSTPTVTIINKKYEYTGNPIKVDNSNVIVSPNSGGKVTIKYYTDKKLKNEIKEVIDAGTYYYRAEVSETKNYTKSYSDIYTLKVERKAIEIPTQTSDEIFVYNAKEQVLRTDTEYYTVSGQTTGTNVGSYEINVKPTSNYAWPDGSTESKTITVKIKPFNISDAYVSNIPSVVYDGTSFKPTPNVVVPLPSVDNPTTLTDNDKIYSYEDNKNAGTATVTITGKGNYTGNVTKTFTINKAEGYVNLSAQSKTITYGVDRVTFDITESHGGILEASDDNASATATINNNKVTVTNLSNIASGSTIVVNVKCNENLNYLEANNTYTITIDKATPEVVLNNKTVTYTGQQITISTDEVSVTPNSGGTKTIKYYTDSNLEHETTVVNAGTYYMKAFVSATSNYTSAESSVATLVVERKEIEVPSQSNDIIYNGTEQTLITNTDKYTVSGNTKGTDVGNYQIVVTPTSNYKWSDDTTDSKTMNYIIDPYDISSASVDTIPNVTYNGDYHTPTPDVVVPIPSIDNPTTLSDSDITYSYRNFRNAGTATVSIEGKGNYTGSIDKNFTIDKAQGYITLSKNSESVVFGTESTTLSVTDGHTRTITYETENSDVVVEITNSGNIRISNLSNIESGTSITITFKCASTNNYTEASATYTLTIGQASPVATLANKTVTYTGNNLIVGVDELDVTTNSAGNKTVKYYSDSNLQNEIDTIVDAGTYYMQVSVAAAGNYEATTSNVATFTVDRKKIDVPTQANTLTYNKSEQTLLTNTEKYTVSGTPKGTNAGNYDVTITPTGNYKWSDGTTTSKTTRVVINPYNISSSNISAIPNETYNGDEITPTPSVSVPLPSVDNPTTLTSSDITYSYSDNVDAGTATVTVTGKGNYTGSASKNFTIEKADGYVVLSDDYAQILHGTDSVLFQIVDSHVPDYEFETQYPVTHTVEGVRISGLSGLSSGTIVEVVVKCRESSNYKEAFELFRIQIVNDQLSGGNVAILGRNIVGETLTASVTNTTPVANYSYQWYRGTPTTFSSTNKIVGATSRTYQVTEDDIGYTLYVEVIASKDGYDDKAFRDKTTSVDNTIATAAKSATIPTDSYCKSLTYTGSSQTLTNTAGEGYSFYDNSGTAVGEYTVSAKLKENYIWSDNTKYDKSFTCSISKSNTTTNLNNIETSYDGTNKTASGATSKLNSNNSSINGSYTYAYYSGNSCSGTALTEAPKDSGTYSVKATLNGTANYYGSTSNCAKLEITSPRAICTSNNESKTYDGTPLTKTGGTCTGLIVGHTATITTSGSITNVSETTNGNNTISSVVIEDSEGNNVSAMYDIVEVPGTLTINPKSTTCTSSSDSKTYDGTPLTKTGGTCTGLVSGHSATFTNTGSATNVSDTSSGNNTVSSVSIMDGSTNVTSNYSITKVAGTLTINPKSITCTSSDGSKTYDGSALTATGGTCTGLISGHSATFTNTGSSTSIYRLLGDVNMDGSVTTDDVELLRQYLANWDVNINEYNADVNKDGISNINDVALIRQYLADWNTYDAEEGLVENTISSVTIKNGTTNVSSNYNITKVPGKLKIHPRHISLETSSQTKTYDGTKLTPTNDCTISSGSLLSGHTLTCTNSISGGATVVGSYTKKIASATIKSGGTDVSNNYYVYTTNSTATITAREITVKADNQSKGYDGTALNADTTCSVVSGSLPSGHTVSCTSSGSITAVGSTTKTLETVTIKNGSNETVTDSFNITKQDGTLTVSDVRDATTGSCKSNLVYNKDSQALASGATNATYTNNSGINASDSYKVTVTANAGHAFSDGTTTKTLTCSIGKKSITITADDKSMTYNASAPTYSYSVSGTVSGDTSVSGTATYTIKNGSTTVSNVSSASVGTYTIVPSGLTINSNYKATYSNGTLTINRKSVSEPSCTSATYNGAEQTLLAAHSSGGYTNSAIKGTDAKEYSTTLTLNSNYKWSSGSNVTSNRTKKCSISKKAVTISAVNKSMTYGGSAPSYSYSVSGGISGETVVSGTAKYTIKNGSTTVANVSTASAGTYTIVLSGLTVNSNYDATYSNGTLTINKRTLNIIVADKSMTFEGSAPNYSYTTSGALTGDTAVFGTPTYTIKNGSTTVANVSTASAGTYTIVISGLTINDDYNPVYTNGTLTINKANTSVTVSGTPIASLETGGSTSTMIVTPSQSGTLVTTKSGTGCSSVGDNITTPKSVTGGTAYTFTFHGSGAGNGCTYTFTLNPTDNVDYKSSSATGKVNKTYGYWTLSKEKTTFTGIDNTTSVVARATKANVDGDTFTMTCTASASSTYVRTLLVNGVDNPTISGGRITKTVSNITGNVALTISANEVPPSGGTDVTLTCSPESEYYKTQTVTFTLKP